jgi:hypothetical protein
MFRIQHTVTIPRSPERVWAVFEDLPAWPKWNPVTPRTKWLTEGQWRRGARLAITLRLKNRRITVRPEVVAVEPNRSVTWVGHALGMSGRHSFTFETEDRGTRVTTAEVFTGPLLFLYRLVLPPARIRASFVQWLDALKAEAER